MVRLKAGFTVIEAIIVLAVTGIIFMSAITLFSGKRSQTEFIQAAYDLESQLQLISNQVKSGSVIDGSQYICIIRGTHDQPAIWLPPPPPPPTSTQFPAGCLTLGNAVQARPDDEQLYIFTVIGLAKDFSTGTPTSSLKESGPSTINGSHSSSNKDLTTTYKYLSGIRIISATVPGQAGRYDLAGFYLVPQSGGSSGQGSTFTGLAYPFVSSAADNYKESNSEARRIENCILQETECLNAITLGRWDLCLQGQNGQERAVLSLIGIPGGISTNLEFKDCS
jgi:hypothetical protein